MAFNPRDIALVTSKDLATRKLNKKLWEAIEDDDLAAIEEYLEKGAQVNYKKWVYGSDLCWTPLHWAVGNNKPELIKLLFRYNCDVLLRTPAGEIAKDLALSSNVHEIIVLLRDLTAQQEKEKAAYIAKFGAIDEEHNPSIKFGIYSGSQKDIFRRTLKAGK